MSVRTFAAVLLDLDGTLIDSEPCHVRAHRRFLSGKGLDVPEARLYDNIGKSDARLFQDLMQEHGLAEDVEEWKQAKSAMLMEILRSEGAPLRSGARALLEHAWSEGLTCCVVTSSPRAVAALALEAVGLAERLPMRVCFEDTAPRHKPDPHPYTLAAQRLGVPIERCLAIEDSTSGIASAHAAGAIVIAVDGHASEADQIAAGAGRVVHCLSELLPLNRQPGATSSFRRTVKKV